VSVPKVVKVSSIIQAMQYIHFVDYSGYAVYSCSTDKTGVILRQYLGAPLFAVGENAVWLSNYFDGMSSEYVRRR